MINQTLSFEITGQDATLFLKACREKNIEPKQAFENFLSQFSQTQIVENDEELRAKKMSYAGRLAQYANPDLIPLEQYAVEMAIKEKYAVN